MRSRRLILSIGAGEAVKKPSNPTQIEQVYGVIKEDKDDDEDDLIDGQKISSEPTITFDLTISSFKVLDAFGSIEENLCRTEEDFYNVPFISEKPSKEVCNPNSDNHHFTIEVQIKNDETFLKKVLACFESWRPLFCGEPRGKLIDVKRRN